MNELSPLATDVAWLAALIEEAQPERQEFESWEYAEGILITQDVEDRYIRDLPERLITPLWIVAENCNLQVLSLEGTPPPTIEML